MVPGEIVGAVGVNAGAGVAGFPFSKGVCVLNLESTAGFAIIRLMTAMKTSWGTRPVVFVNEVEVGRASAGNEVASAVLIEPE